MESKTHRMKKPIGKAKISMMIRVHLFPGKYAGLMEEDSRQTYLQIYNLGNESITFLVSFINNL